MKNGKKCWKMKSIAGIILTCIFLTACGEETKELMTGNDELKILEEVEKTEDRETVYELAGDFTKSYFQEEYAHESPTHRILHPGGTHMILPLLASDMLSIPLPNIDWAIQVDTTQGGLLLTSQLSIETNKLGL